MNLKTNPLPNPIESWFQCKILHTQKPVYTGKKIWDELTKKWKKEIIWVCDKCKKNKKENNGN